MPLKLGTTFRVKQTEYVLQPLLSAHSTLLYMQVKYHAGFHHNSVIRK